MEESRAVIGTYGDEYEVDVKNQTCTCKDFIYHRKNYDIGDYKRLCKHLRQLIDERELVLVSSKELPISYTDALSVVEEISMHLNAFSNTHIKRYEFCGSLRRKRPVVGDLDVVLEMYPGSDVHDFYHYIEDLGMFINKVKGDTKSSYIYNAKVHVDFNVIPSPEYWAFHLLHFTGPKVENIRLRKISAGLGLGSLSQYGFDEDPKGLKTEEEIYHYLGEEYLAPEDRQQ